jgi:hypothetical protein
MQTVQYVIHTILLTYLTGLYLRPEHVFVFLSSVVFKEYIQDFLFLPMFAST